MADNFNLRTFLTENKLTKNAQLLAENKEEAWEEGYSPKSKLEQVIQAAWAEKDLNRAKQLVIDLIEPSRINSKQQILDTLKSINNKGKLDQYLANSLLKFEKLGLSETEGELEEDNAVPEDSTDMAIDMMKNGLPREDVRESKLTAREKRLVEMVEEALDLEGHGDDNVYHKLEKRGDQPAQQAPTYSEGEDHYTDDLENKVSNDDAYGNAFDTMEEGEEMVQENPLPKYENIEKLMQEIEKETDKAGHDYKVSRMKEVANALEEKATGLEEGDNAEHIDIKKLKQMKKDVMALRKNIEKLEKIGEKKFKEKEVKKEDK